MIPGSNLLKAALSVIAPQTIVYYKYTGKTTSSIGTVVSSYAAPTNISGSFQPIPKRLYSQSGLDLSKVYFNFYAPENLLDVARNVSGDQIVFQNNRYQVLSKTDWYGVDGWVGVICVLISNPSLTDFGVGPSNENFNNGNFDAN